MRFQVTSSDGQHVFKREVWKRIHGMAPRLAQSTLCPSSTTTARNLSPNILVEEVLPADTASARHSGHDEPLHQERHSRVLIMSSAG